MIFNTNVAINDTHYNPCHFHFCTTLVRRKCYFIFTKLQSSEVFREIPTLSPRLTPAKLKDKHAVFISCRLKMEGCRLHRQQLLLLFDFYFVVIMSNFRTETSEESCICEISINLYFCTCLFIFFLILQTLMFIYLKFTPIKKKPRGVSIVVKGLEAGVFFTGVGSNPMPIFLFSFIPLVTLKK